jgi:3-deoxy-manno-octulosonate cytidylyltransferase (CMP-KDO synthetase)
MKILGIIPARMAATRFPNKPMVSILGIPMVGHVYIRTKKCDLLNEVYVATCDQVIIDYTKSISGRGVMTSDNHERATDRSAEALLQIEKELGTIFDIIVMIQGDEPLVMPDMIASAAKTLIDDPKSDVSNLMQELISEEDIDNQNNVKVVTDINGYALYFSREAIPSRKKYNKKIKVYKQLGLIAFRRQALLDFIYLKPTPLEIIESVDMNRFLEHGKKIKMIVTDIITGAIDTPEDLVRVQSKMEKDQLFKEYSTKL